MGTVLVDVGVVLWKRIRVPFDDDFDDKVKKAENFSVGQEVQDELKNFLDLDSLVSQKQYVIGQLKVVEVGDTYKSDDEVRQ